MRLLDEKDTEAMHKEVLAGAAKAFAISTVVAVSGAILAQRYSETFRNLRAPLRVAAVIMPIVGGVTVGAEEALLAHERRLHLEHDVHAVADQSKPVIKRDFDMKRFVADHRYHFVAGAWVAGVAGTLAMSYGNPYLTATQKAFHARVYSQGITVAALIGTALLTPFATDKKADLKLESDAIFQRRLAYEEARLAAQEKQQHAA